MASGLGLTPSLLGTGDGGADPSGQGLAPCRESICPGNWASCSGIQPQHLLHILMRSLCQAPGGLWEDRASVTGSSQSHGATKGEGHHGDSEKSSDIGYLERQVCSILQSGPSTSMWSLCVQTDSHTPRYTHSYTDTLHTHTHMVYILTCECTYLSQIHTSHICVYTHGLSHTRGCTYSHTCMHTLTSHTYMFGHTPLWC